MFSIHTFFPSCCSSFSISTKATKHFYFQQHTPGTRDKTPRAAGEQEAQGGTGDHRADPPVHKNTSSVKNSEAVVNTEDTRTKSPSEEDLSETDKVEGDQARSDSESSDSETNSSLSHLGDTELVPGASAPGRAGANPNSGRVKANNHLKLIPPYPHN